MYVIVEKAKLEGKFFGIMNTLPDGRVYIPISEMRNVGTLLDIDIIGSARELKELIDKQQEAMQGSEDIDPVSYTHLRKGTSTTLVDMDGNGWATDNVDDAIKAQQAIVNKAIAKVASHDVTSFLGNIQNMKDNDIASVDVYKRQNT